ncbi:MAG: hypothetical protein M1313_03790 [Nitrospirae bacterium]|nr:hypothetical protein [Nitrospirota bacterium]
MPIGKRKASLVFCLLVAWLLGLDTLSSPPASQASEDFSEKAQEAGKNLSKSVEKGLHKTGEYLKSDDFHQKVQRVTAGAAEAIRKSGDWVGKKLDSLGKTGSSK